MARREVSEADEKRLRKLVEALADDPEALELLIALGKKLARSPVRRRRRLPIR